MPWYLYTGNRVQAVSNGVGNTVAVQPYGKVEILKMTPTTQKMVSRGVLRLTGAPPAQEQRPKSVPGPAEVLTPSAFAQYFVEVGKTHIPGHVPVSPQGVPKTGMELIVEAEAKAGMAENVSEPEPNASVEEAATEADGGRVPSKRRR